MHEIVGIPTFRHACQVGIPTFLQGCQFCIVLTMLDSEQGCLDSEQAY